MSEPVHKFSISSVSKIFINSDLSSFTVEKLQEVVELNCEVMRSGYVENSTYEFNTTEPMRDMDSYSVIALVII